MSFEHITIENTYSGQLVLPRYVYHATLTKYVKGLQSRLLDRSWWRKTDRDFGAAFYTTISFKQAAEWAEKAEEKNIGSTGCVIKIQCFPQYFPKFSNCLVFLGETNPQWTKFIVDHRYECDVNGSDPCGQGKHPAIIIGQMADNKMDLVKSEYDGRQQEIMENKYEWFTDKITRNKEGRQLDAMELGNQIAFCDESMNELLTMDSYFIFDEARKEWAENELRSEI